MKTGQGKVTSRALNLVALCGLILTAGLARAASQPLFNPQADASQDIAAAIARASKTGRNIVLIFGANW